jgi:diguanylate cyclase (GGDEF)-like protein
LITITSKNIIHRIGVLIVTVVVLCVPFYYLYNNTDKIVVNQAGRQAIGVAVSIAKFIEMEDQDYVQLVAVDDYSTGNYDQVYYEKMLKVFQQIKKETGADYVYTEKKISDTNIAYLFDAETPGSDTFSPIGSSDNLGRTESLVFQTGTVGSSGLIKDPVWGTYVTGAAPIRNLETGEVISVVGVDYSSEQIVRILKNVRNFLIVTMIGMSILINILIDRLVENRNKSLRTDFLTRLYSKQYLQQYLPELIRSSKNTGQPISLILMDIDHFKEINDNFGHLNGDRVLSVVAKNLHFNIRDTDLCFRYGGDEFIVILPNTHSDQAEMIGTRIQEHLKNNPVVVNEDGTAKRVLTFSMGVVEWTRSMNASQLIELADQSMYTSKKAGRNRITIYNQNA